MRKPERIALWHDRYACRLFTPCSLRNMLGSLIRDDDGCASSDLLGRKAAFRANGTLAAGKVAGKLWLQLRHGMSPDALTGRDLRLYERQTTSMRSDGHRPARAVWGRGEGQTGDAGRRAG